MEIGNIVLPNIAGEIAGAIVLVGLFLLWVLSALDEAEHGG